MPYSFFIRNNNGILPLPNVDEDRSDTFNGQLKIILSNSSRKIREPRVGGTVEIYLFFRLVGVVGCTR